MYKRYGFIGLLKLLVSFLYTKLNYPNARIIRLPFDIRNSHLVEIGKGFTVGFGCRLEAHPINNKNLKCILFGENVEINDYVHIAAGEMVTIGDNVLIASRVFITDLNHGNYNGDKQDPPNSLAKKRKLSTSPVVIENNVWIGESVSILPGVTIGENSIIGANSLVCKNIPKNVIAVGNPARIIKEYNFTTNSWVSI